MLLDPFKGHSPSEPINIQTLAWQRAITRLCVQSDPRKLSFTNTGNLLQSILWEKIEGRGETHTKEQNMQDSTRIRTLVQDPELWSCEKAT